MRLAVLGSMSLSTPDGAPAGDVLAGDRRTALLLYLAMALPAMRRRESVVALLWPEEPSNRARHSLRQLLHVLRERLGEGVIVTIGDEYVGVDGSRLWCDAVAFRSAIREAAHERALELYAGPFCDGFSFPNAPDYDRWLESTRTELHEAAFSAARQLARRERAAGQLESAITWGKRAVRLAPEDEGMLRWLLGASEEAGGPCAALRMYDEYVRVIREEFELRPSAALVAEMARLRAACSAFNPTA